MAYSSLKRNVSSSETRGRGSLRTAKTYFQSSLWKITSVTSSSETILVKLFLFLFTRPMKLSDRWRLQTLFFRGTTGNMPAVCTSGFLPNLWVVCTVRFKLLDMFMNVFPHVIVALFYLPARDIALRYDTFRNLDQFSIKFLNCHVLSLTSVLF